jgi:hypothetical protein
MAKFLTKTLSHIIQGPFVMFISRVKIQFDDGEIGKQWRIEIILSEKDLLSPDDTFQNENWGRTITANKETVEVELNVPINKRDLNTEFGKEEVYATLKLVHPETSLVAAQTKTNTIKVDL